ncbi:MAG: hypothetical protein A2505_03750 [Deltaproteobacteria bacterium RIFOXYD12_FULL_55_16]|nr:MAG: hypothetical protein A2505_03750 [Deltaproteobacteria bacterium RIFOXYD12_FULL_55_16]
MRGIWARLTLIARVMLCASLALSLAGSSLLLLATSKEADFLHTHLEEHLTSEMEAVSLAISEWAVIGDYANIKQVLQLRIKYGNIQHIAWTNARGRQLSASAKAIPALRAPGWFVRCANILSPQASRALVIGGRDYGQVSIEMTATPYQNRLWEEFLRNLAILGLALGLDLIVILLILKNGLRPLAALKQGASTLERGEMASRIAPQGSPELVHVIQAFNRMAAALETAQDSLRQKAEQRTLAASVFENALNAIIITDAQKRILEVNPAFTRITGYSRAEALGQTPHLLASGRHDPGFYAAMWAEIKNTGQWRGEIWNRHKNGKIYPEDLAIVAVRDEEGAVTSYLGIFSDISQVKEQEAQLQHLAHYDSLTGLPNRALLADRLKVALAQAGRSGERLAVCYLDLDGFKPVNDTWGHATGDRLLEEVAGRLREAVRGGDSVARLGGDEFALLLAKLTDMEECELVLSRLLQSVARPIFLDGATLAVTASIGITFFPDDGADADTLLRHADQAMYLAKEAGRNCYQLFDSHHDQAARERRAFVLQMETALEQDEFCLYYQPKVDMRAGTVIGAEALIRWRHPEQGLIEPAGFLSQMAGSALEIRLGEWVIDTALTQMDAWHAAGLDLPVAVNIAPQHLARSDFAFRLKELLDQHPGLPVNRLELEVLESVALDDLEHVSRLIEDCRKIGVSFALDNFGTGYSSLTCLKRLPVDLIKIDLSFVRDMLGNAEKLAIVEGVIGLAEAFHISVIAEGVETVAQGLSLIQLGCSLGQGYGIARPMLAPDLPGWIAAWQPDLLWRQAPATWSRDDAVLLGAELDHRLWVGAMQAFVDGGQSVGQAELKFPPLNPLQCRFGRWYHGPGRLRYGGIAEFMAIDPLHQQVHAAGEAISALCRSGQIDEAQRRMVELMAQRDELIAQLHLLARVINACPCKGEGA